jgi:hypothetical protein
MTVPSPVAAPSSASGLRQLLLDLAGLQTAAESRLRHLVAVTYAFCATLLIALPVVAVVLPHVSSTFTRIQVAAPNGTQELQLGTGDILAVELWGALGGLVGVIGTLNRFRMSGPGALAPVAQLVLKPLAGAAVALVGVVAVEGDLISQLEPVSRWSIPAWAALFGFSQQLITRLLDGRAQALSDAASTTSQANTS